MNLIINIDVPDLAHTRTLDDDVAELRGASSTIYLLCKPETGHIDWRGSRCLSFSDPFGHGFCFIQFEENGTSQS
jgi:hypothetical protein